VWPCEIIDEPHQQCCFGVYFFNRAPVAAEAVQMDTYDTHLGLGEKGKPYNPYKEVF